MSTIAANILTTFDKSKQVNVSDVIDLFGPTGSSKMGFKQSGIGAANRTTQDKLRESVSVKDYGAKGDGVTNDSAAIAATVQALKDSGFGGVVFYPPGVYMVNQSIPVDTNIRHVGAGRSITTVRLIAGSNVDVFKSVGFDSLTNVGNVSSAPYGFGISHLSIDGQYLDLSSGKTWRTSDTVLNSAGCGIKLYGSRFDLDVEVYNVADNALYCEGGGSFYENQEHASRINLTGRISGQEGIVFRGPGDINMEYVIFGLCGTLPRTQRLTSTGVNSKLYPTMKCVGLMLDNDSPFTGHVEMGMVHIYAISYNYGVFTKGVNRFNARHIVAENSLGGFYFGDGAHGVGAIIEARANGRMPDAYTGSSIVGLPDVFVNNGTIWNINLTIKSYRYAPSRDYSGFIIDIAGSNNNIRCAIFSQLQGDNLPLLGSALRVAGSNNTVNLTAQRIRGVLCHVLGDFNNIRGNAVSIYAGTALIRENGYGNSINLVAGSLTSDSVGFNSIGTVGAENINLIVSGSSGYTPFTGAPMAALNRSCTWQIAATTGNTINGKTTEDYIEVPIPGDVIAGTIVVPHNFLYTPNRTQVNLSMNFPGTAPNQVCHLGVQGVPTATDVTIAFRWTAIPTSGGATLQVHIR